MGLLLLQGRGSGHWIIVIYSLFFSFLQSLRVLLNRLIYWWAHWTPRVRERRLFENRWRNSTAEYGEWLFVCIWNYFRFHAMKTAMQLYFFLYQFVPNLLTYLIQILLPAWNSRRDQRIWLTELHWRRLCRGDLLVFGLYQERILPILSSIMLTSGKKTNLVLQLYLKSQSLVEFSWGPIPIF